LKEKVKIKTAKTLAYLRRSRKGGVDGKTLFKISLKRVSKKFAKALPIPTSNRMPVLLPALPHLFGLLTSI
jgi:hypothetical protein